jgi:hypothetical protein
LGQKYEFVTRGHGNRFREFSADSKLNERYHENWQRYEKSFGKYNGVKDNFTNELVRKMEKLKIEHGNKEMLGRDLEMKGYGN